jgi:hypothetical protein
VVEDFFFYEYDELPDVERAKKCIEQIARLGERAGAPLNVVASDLAKEMNQLSFSMFCVQKQKKKTFTVCNNSKLRKMRINEDYGTLVEEDSLLLQDFLYNNIEAFAQLVAISYIKKPQRASSVDERLFFASIYSLYTDEQVPVYFYNSDGVFFIFEDKPTKITLKDYVTDYFSSTIADEINNLEEKTLSMNLTFIEMQRIVTKVFDDIREENHEHEFISGAITFLDFLAWKGLWQAKKGKDTLNEVSSLIDNFKNELDIMSQSLYTGAKGIRLSKLISISDTIAIFTPKVTSVSVCQLLELHVNLSKMILEKCAKEKYPIRGAISFGEYSVLNNIMIGPGIDECAGWHETGNWIGVHLTPTAQIHLDSQDRKKIDNICKYSIPLRSGLDCEYCVKWVITRDEFKDLSLNTKALLPEISCKYTNTYKFLKKTAWGDEDDGK